MIRDMEYRIGLLTCVVTMFASGCGGDAPEMAYVTGKVVLNGETVPGGKVMFNPQAIEDTTEATGRPAVGIINSDGEFTLSTYEDGDGAVIGMHTVEYYSPDPEKLRENDDAESAAWFAGKKIYVPADMKFEVTDDDNEITVELKER